VPRVDWYLAGGKSGTAPSVNDGTLAAAKPGAGRDTFTVNYDVGKGEYFAFWPQPMTDKGLSYTSAPLPANRKLVGAPILHLDVASDRKEAIIFAYLEDVGPDGKAVVISHGRLAASQRKLGTPPYDTLGLPWQSGRSGDVQPLVPGKAVSLDLALLPTARRLPAGHRLRVTITGADPRQRNLAELKEDPAPQLTVLRGTSRISLPLQP
jgi:putative CocE/NonD family hydrolase